MVDYTNFSATSGACLPCEFLEAYYYYVLFDPKGHFDTQYFGRQWHEELIDGVQFFFPAPARPSLGIVEMSVSGCVVNAAVRDKP